MRTFGIFCLAVLTTVLYVLVPAYVLWFVCLYFEIGLKEALLGYFLTLVVFQGFSKFFEAWIEIFE